MPPSLTATFHPSAILRMPDAVKRREAREMLVEDLRLVAQRLQALAVR